MGPANGIIGDAQPTALPESSVDDGLLSDERKKARYSKSAEFKQIQEWCQLKIAKYQSFLPGGIPVTAVSDEERGKYWAVADIVITELTELMNMYETTAEVVNELNSK